MLNQIRSTTTTTRLRQWSTHAMAVPALMAILIAAVGAQVALVAKIPSWANDEPPHLGYIATLAGGELPTIDSPTIDDPERFGEMADRLNGWDEAHDQIWTANHPPLYHLALVPLWWLGDGDPGSVFIGMRLVGTLGFALWVLLVALIARELAPDRPAVPALAAVLAVTPTLTIRAGYLLGDGYSATGALLLMLMTIRMLRGEVTSGRIAVAVLGGVVAAGTRAPGVLAVALCTLVLWWVVSRRDGWRRGTLTAGIVGGVPALATAWFYLRNLRLYGDLTGQDALLEKFGRSRVDALRDIAEIPGLWEIVQVGAPALLALALFAPAAAIAAWRRGEFRLDAVWFLLLVHAGVTGVNLVGFLAAGGGFHDRYLMAVMPLLAVFAVLGMLHVGRWLHRRCPSGAQCADAMRRDAGAAAVWTVVLLAWLGATGWWLQQRHIFIEGLPHPVTGLLPGLLIGLAVVAGLGVAVLMVRQARVAAEGP